MREAYNGTHKGMDEVYLGVSVFMCDVCVLVGGGGGQSSEISLISAS